MNSNSSKYSLKGYKMDRAVKIEISNSLGIILKQINLLKLENPQMQFNISDFQPGLYQINVQAEGLRRQVKTFAVIKD